MLGLIQRHLAKVGKVRARQRHVGAVRVAALHVPHTQPRPTRHNVPGQVDRPLLNVREGMQKCDAAAFRATASALALLSRRDALLVLESRWPIRRLLGRWHVPLALAPRATADRDALIQCTLRVARVRHLVQG